MAGMIGIGQDYGGKALSGFIRESTQQNQMDLANKKASAQQQANMLNTLVHGGTAAYLSAPTVQGWLTPSAAPAAEVGNPIMLADSLTVAPEAGLLSGGGVAEGALLGGATVAPALSEGAAIGGGEAAAAAGGAEAVGAGVGAAEGAGAAATAAEGAGFWESAIEMLGMALL